MSTNNYKHWHYKKDEQDRIILSIDKHNAKTNVLSKEVLDEFNSILDVIAQSLPKSLIIKSSKKDGFIAGADINEFLTVQNINEARSMIQRGQNAFEKLADFKAPTICIINGFCMGGGTELALACDYRIATNDGTTKIGLPEVKLGIHPAFGGVVRATQKLNPLKAMQWMLTGKGLSAKQAKRMKLVDYQVPKHLALATAFYITDHNVQPSTQSLWDKACNAPILRPSLAWFVKRKMSQKVNVNHYPAPFALLDIWNKFGGSPELLMRAEVDSVAKLIQGVTVKNLIRVFFLQTALKNQVKKTTSEFKHVHVIGGGVMGGDIAAWCALNGYTTSLQDQQAENLELAIQRADKLFSRKAQSKADYNRYKSHLIPDINGDGVRHADVLIEAIFENLEAKQQLFKQIEPLIKKDCVMASNTSSIPLEEIASVLKKPDRLMGLHFFNPVARMPLLEIVKTEQSSKNSIKQALAFSKAIKKLPVVVKSSPGFLVNRILMPYLMEAMTLLNSGESAERIDQAALNFGMPMGPIELADAVGLDICLSVAKHLSHHYDFKIPYALENKVNKKYLGKKTQHGFYHYKKNKPIKTKDFSDHQMADLEHRLISKLTDEARKCLSEEIADSQDLIDAAVIFGTGFAPFKGGPLHYLDSLKA